MRNSITLIMLSLIVSHNINFRIIMMKTFNFTFPIRLTINFYIDSCISLFSLIFHYSKELNFKIIIMKSFYFIIYIYSILKFIYKPIYQIVIPYFILLKIILINDL